MNDNDIPSAKSEIRAAAIAKRETLSPEVRQAGAQVIAGRTLPIPVKPGMIVSGFMPMRSEINPLPLMRAFAAAGATLALPVIQKRGQPLIMRAYAIGDELASGQWGIREPKPESPEVFPDAMIVPLAAFDRRGHRIGYGAGYFDMTIARLRKKKPVIAMGLAFAAQEVLYVPSDDWDEPLDLVLTEREVIVPAGA